jgi:hypothetical protein
MRLVTWNCSKGPYEKKVPRLDSLNGDIAVVQECPKPLAESKHCLWFGDNAKQGILILAAQGYSLRRLPILDDVPKFVIPVGVAGPIGDITVYAVWSKNNPQYPYIESVVRAVEINRNRFSESPCVLMGDLNSNAILDHQHPKAFNHSALVQLQGSLGLVSAYHAFFVEEQREETRCTYYVRWNEKAPFHIDYCFIPPRDHGI